MWSVLFAFSRLHCDSASDGRCGASSLQSSPQDPVWSTKADKMNLNILWITCIRTTDTQPTELRHHCKIIKKTKFQLQCYFVPLTIAVKPDTHWPTSEALAELWKQKVVVELIDALDAGKHLWNHVVRDEMLVVIAVQQLVMKHLTLKHVCSLARKLHKCSSEITPLILLLFCCGTASL